MKCKEICADCGNVFMAGPKELICQKCRCKRMSAAAKRRENEKQTNKEVTNE